MKRTYTALSAALVTLLCAVLVFAAPGTQGVAASNTTAGTASTLGESDRSSERTAATLNELLQLMTSYPGEPITVTQDIIISQDTVLAPGYATTITLGKYGFVLPEGGRKLTLGGLLTLQGSGEESPVLSVGSGSRLTLRNGVTIIARGATGTAVSVRGYGELLTDTSPYFPAYILTTSPTIQSLGSNGVGISSAGNLALEGLRVYTPGAGATGVVASGRIELFYTQVTSGGVSVRSSSNSLLLDNSVVSPPAAGATVVKSVPTMAKPLEQQGLHTSVGQAITFPSLLPLSFARSNGKTATLYFPVTWGGSYNPQKEGQYTVVPAFTSTIPAIPLAFPTNRVSVYVVSASAPWIKSATRTGRSQITITFLTPVNNVSSLLLWYKDSANGQWYELNGQSTVHLYATGARIDGIANTVDKAQYFQIEVPSVTSTGFSNAIRIQGDVISIMPMDPTGGDRDQENVNPSPWQPSSTVGGRARADSAPNPIAGRSTSSVPDVIVTEGSRLEPDPTPAPEVTIPPKETSKSEPSRTSPTTIRPSSAPATSATSSLESSETSEKEPKESTVVSTDAPTKKPSASSEDTGEPLAKELVSPPAERTGIFIPVNETTLLIGAIALLSIIILILSGVLIYQRRR